MFNEHMSIENYRYPADEFVRDDVRATQYVATYDRVSVLSPREPHWEGWLMVVPNQVIEKIEDLSEEVWRDVCKVVRALHAVHFKKDETYEGLMFFGNRGSEAGQHVPHAHFHVVPRFSNRAGSPFKKPDRALPVDALAAHVRTYRSLLPGDLGEVKPRLNLAVQCCEHADHVSTHGDLNVWRCTSNTAVYEVRTPAPARDLLFEASPALLDGIQPCLHEIVERFEATGTYKGYTLTAEVHVRKKQSFPIRAVGRFSDEVSSPLRTLPTLFATA